MCGDCGELLCKCFKSLVYSLRRLGRLPNPAESFAKLGLHIVDGILDNHSLISIVALGVDLLIEISTVGESYSVASFHVLSLGGLCRRVPLEHNTSLQFSLCH